MIAAQAQSYDDELAAGATLEELAETTDLRLGTVAWTGGEQGGVAGYEAFRAAADAVGPDDFPQIDGLGDGGVFALRLDGVREPAPYPYDEVAGQVRADWRAEQRREALVERAEALQPRLSSGDSFADLGLTPRSAEGLTRNGFTVDVPPAVQTEAFTLEPGQSAVLPVSDGAVLMRLDTVTAPDPDNPDTARLRSAIEEQAAGSVATDLFRALASDIQSRAADEIDRQAVNAVQCSLQ